jgi:hypothetical protein
MYYQDLTLLEHLTFATKSTIDFTDSGLNLASAFLFVVSNWTIC